MRWLVLILVIIGAVLLVVRRQPASAPVSPAGPAPTPAAVPAGPTPPPAEHTAAGSPPLPPPPATAANAGLRRNIPAELNAIAIRVGVRLLAFQPSAPGQAVVAIEWSGDNAALGGDFIEAALRENVLRDFEPTPTLGQSMQQGRRVFVARYQVKY